MSLYDQYTQSPNEYKHLKLHWRLQKISEIINFIIISMYTSLSVPRYNTFNKQVPFNNTQFIIIIIIIIIIKLTF
jgi:hypothetical protein